MNKFITRWTSQGTLLEIHGVGPLLAFDEMEKMGATMIRYEGGKAYGIVDFPSLTLRESLSEIVKWTKQPYYPDKYEPDRLECILDPLESRLWSWLPWWRRWWKKVSGDEIKRAVK